MNVRTKVKAGAGPYSCDHSDGSHADIPESAVADRVKGYFEGMGYRCKKAR